MDERPEEHPILARDIVRSDGSHTIAFRVFCSRRGQSVPLSTCQDCAAYLDIAADGPGADGCVRCSPAPVAAGARITGGEPVGGARTNDGSVVADVLTKGILCVASDMGVPAVIALFVERTLGGVFVVDDDGGLLGLIREVDFIRSRPVEDRRVWLTGGWGALRSTRSRRDDFARAIVFAEPTSSEERQRSAGEMMSSAIAVREDTPVRRAILRMAESHLRDVAVVTRAGELVGALRDIEGLRWIAAHARRC